MMKIFLCLIALVLLFGTDALAAITLNSGATGCFNNSDHNNISSGALTTTGSSLMIVGFVQANNVTQVGPSSSLGNTFTALTTKDSGTASVTLYYAENITTGSDTITSSVFAGFQSMCVLTLDGAKTSSPFDQQNGATGSFQTGQAGSVTPTEDNEIVVSFFGSRGTGPVTVDSGFTALSGVGFSAGDNTLGAALAYKVQTTAAAADPTWDAGSFGFSQAIVVGTFKAASGSGGGTSASSRAMSLGIGMGNK